MRTPGGVSALILSSTMVISTASAQQIVIGGGYGAPPKAEKVLAEIAKASDLNVPAGADPIVVARAQCGRATETYIGLLRAANRRTTVAPASVPRIMKFPACFVINPNQKNAVRLGSETLQAFALRVIGTGGADTVKALQAHNSHTPLAATGQNARLVVPFTSAPIVYDLNPRAAAKPAQAAAKVVAAFGQPVKWDSVANSQPDDLQSMSGVSVHKKVTCDLNRKELPDASWPFSVDDVLKALKRNVDFRKASGLQVVRTSTVAVADNGVDGLFGANFPVGVLLTNPGDALNSGANVFTDLNPSPVPPGGLADRQHGTLMASLAIGGPDLRKVSTGAAPAEVLLLPISMVERRTSWSPSGNVTTYAYPVQSAAEALRYAESRNADVLNLSVGTSSRIKTFEDLAAQYNPITIVAAAGNDATNFNVLQVYPAAYGGDQGRLNDRLIAVGASDRRGCLADFSGRGAKTVDILAPGVAISAISLGGVPETADGTSQATALVSFTVGVLKSEGLIDPLGVKDRLFATADRHPELAPFVISSGVLNIPKAISLHHDIWETSDGSVSFGRLAKPLSLLDLCPDQGDAADVKILRVTWQGGPEPLLVAWRAAGGTRSEFGCKPLAGFDHIDFIDEHGVQTPIKLDQIVTLVPH